MGVDLRTMLETQEALQVPARCLEAAVLIVARAAPAEQQHAERAAADLVVLLREQQRLALSRQQLWLQGVVHSRFVEALWQPG